MSATGLSVPRKHSSRADEWMESVLRIPPGMYLFPLRDDEHSIAMSLRLVLHHLSRYALKSLATYDPPTSARFVSPPYIPLPDFLCKLDAAVLLNSIYDNFSIPAIESSYFVIHSVSLCLSQLPIGPNM